MEYPKIINLLDDRKYQLSKFRAWNWVEINDESLETYDYISDIKFKTLMVRSNFRVTPFTNLWKDIRWGKICKYFTTYPIY